MTKTLPTFSDSEIPQCIDCGLCCQRKWIVEVDKDTKIPSDMWIDDGVVPRMKYSDKTNACIAYCHEKKCTIYDIRPTGCRNFERGSTFCIRTLLDAGRLK